MTNNPPLDPKKTLLGNISSLRSAFVNDLKGFASPDRGAKWEGQGFREGSPDYAEFPVPDLLLILLRDVMNFPSREFDEKERWAIFFKVDEQPVYIRFMKFGLRIGSLQRDPEFISRVKGQLRTALRRLEKRLSPLLNEAIELGNATIPNRIYEFRGRYQFFRDHAGRSFQMAKFSPTSSDGVEKNECEQSIDREENENIESKVSAVFSRIFEEYNRNTSARREGFFFSVAMIDAYFSYLEHRLILMRAFTGKALVHGELINILRARWDKKFEMIGLASVERGRLLGRLKTLKERIRNPFAHGGIENDGGSIYCHVPNVGPIPANMSAIGKGVRFGLIPVDTEEHESACTLFDSIDEFLGSGDLRVANALAEGGLHAAWDADHLRSYRQLQTATDDEVEAHILHWHDEQDRFENMDF
ncbi:hypothetical protein [Burkholderia gladioli]|uniref:hypothetical protein n=1 Tax=Burkholderia gladioli TaxID=28095 RepID=UPI00163FE5B7|nr:hypothetical protein [Burkholderia gladioli]